MSLSYGGSARRIKARRPFSRKSVPQLRMKFEALGFKMASDPTMMTNRAPLGGQGPKLAANAIWSAITGGCPLSSWATPIQVCGWFLSHAATAADASTTLVNLEFTQWQLQDQIVLSALISSLSEKVIAHVIYYQLSTLRKGSTSVADFFHTFTGLADILAAIDQPLPEFQLSQAPVSLETTSANFASRGTSSRSGRGGCNHSSPSTGRGHSTSPSFKSNRGRGCGRNSPTDARPVCQVCNRADHVALHCYHRFDNSYYSERSAVMQAYFSTQQAPNDPNWYTDTGATHHLTSNLANLNVHSKEYLGSDQIWVGNGKGLSVAHTGYKCLHHPSSRIYISRDVIFEETVFPFQNGPPIPIEPTQPTPTPPGLPLLIKPTLPHQARPNNPSPHLISSPSSPVSPAVPILSPTASSHPASTPTLTSQSPTPIAPSHPMVTRSKANIFKPKQFHDGTVRYPLPHAFLAETASSLSEPTCYSSAVKDPQWL
uniref:Retroviral polymerase SH3-like domain-containing protein n=1 Tax=Fagus sylvatica TaxID=28930 RepID=A0A2N9H017_FAGSY